MDRAEVIAALREAYRAGGMSALFAAADIIRQHGQIHDTEFLICVDCAVEFPRPPGTASGTALPLRCDECRTAKNNAARNKRRTT
jgi:hypothetical protein